MRAELRIAFAGTPDFAVPSLEAMVNNGFTPLAVLTQPDRPAGRGRKAQTSPVQRAAREHGITVMQPKSLSRPPAQDALRELDLDLLVVVAYGLILPQSVLGIPRHGCWNVHASLLPRWRGAAPIQRAIEAGDAASGVCIMQMEAGLDTGPVLLKAATDLSPGETGGSLHDRLADMGAAALLECLHALQRGQAPQPTPQDDSLATYARKLSKQEAEIDWHDPAGAIERRVRAFNPWPVCWCEIGDARLRVWRASALPGGAGQTPGTVIAANPAGIDIATANGILRLLEVQRAGGKRMPVAAYLNAHSVAMGS